MPIEKTTKRRRTWQLWMSDVRTGQLAEILGLSPAEIAILRGQGLPFKRIQKLPFFLYDTTVVLHWLSGRSLARLLGIRGPYPAVATTLNGFIAFACSLGLEPDEILLDARLIGLRAGGSPHLVDRLLAEHPLRQVRFPRLPAAASHGATWMRIAGLTPPLYLTPLARSDAAPEERET